MSRLLSRFSLFALTGFGLASLAQTPQAPVPTLHATANLIVVDVVVMDTNHHAIHNLKQSDFTVFERNTPQTIKGFEKHTAGAQLPPLPQLPPGVFTDRAAAPAGAVNVLLIDRLNTGSRDQSRLQQQLFDYLNHARPGTRIAIFSLTSRLALLQGFTDDPALLRAAVGKQVKTGSSALLEDPTGGGGGPQTISGAMGESANQLLPTASMTAMVKNVGEQENKIIEVREDDRIQGSLTAMQALAHYLDGFPGRKNLLWFSGAFPLKVAPDNDSKTPALIAQYEQTAALLARAQVAIYPVALTGLAPPASGIAGEGGQGAVDKGPNTDAMKDLAEETGGRAFYTTNGFTDAIDSAIADGSSYYSLAYTPADTHWNGGFRKIEVRLENNRTAVLSYRRGYYALDPAASSAPASSGTVASGGGSAAMRQALLYGSPQPSELLFTAQVNSVTTSTEEALATGNEGSKGLKGPFIRYAVNYNADPSAISFAVSDDGVRHGAIEFVAFVYDGQGRLINGFGTPVNATFHDATYQTALEHGIAFRQEISIPAKGDYFLRMAVHDMQGDRVGAIEVPIAAVRGLPPSPAPAPVLTKSEPAQPVTAPAPMPAPAAPVSSPAAVASETERPTVSLGRAANNSLEATMSWVKGAIAKGAGFGQQDAPVKGKLMYEVNDTTSCHVGWHPNASGNDDLEIAFPSIDIDEDLRTVVPGSVTLRAIDPSRLADDGTEAIAAAPSASSYWEVAGRYAYPAKDANERPFDLIFTDRQRAQQIADALNHAVDLCHGPDAAVKVVSGANPTP